MSFFYVNKFVICIGISLLAENVFFSLVAQAQVRDNLFGIIRSPGMQESYGINDQTVLEKQDYSTGMYPYATRHGRRGEDTGIGGSYIDTTNVTSETAKAMVPNVISPVARVTAPPEMKVQSMYGNLEKTPALSGDLSEASFALTPDKARRSSALSPVSHSTSQSSWSATEEELVKKPIQLNEPLEYLNLHKTDSGIVSPYQ